MPTDTVKALRQTALFGSLGEEELKALASRATEVEISRDQVLFVAGEEANKLYVIVEGVVRAFRGTAEGREQVIHVERAGATIAEVPVFDSGPFPSSVAAEEDSTLLVIDKDDVLKLCLEYPQIALAALKVLSARLRRMAELVEALSLHEVDRRLARLILAEVRSKGVLTERGAAVDLSMTNQQIASRIGTVREVVSRALNRLQQSELIIVQGRRITVPDLESLSLYVAE
jgi:CRP/FNR family transcriptional regulator